jgi:hypothetical protein
MPGRASPRLVRPNPICCPVIPPPAAKDPTSAPGGQTDGADGSRGKAPSAPDRLRAYGAILLRIDNGPAKLGKQSDAWLKQEGAFDGPEEKKRAAIYAIHLNRLTGSIDVEACKAQVEGVIGK